LFHNINMEWNEKLKQARIAQGLSQQKIADILKVTRGCYANYEHGQREPNFALLKQICDTLDISADYLIGRVEY